MNRVHLLSKGIGHLLRRNSALFTGTRSLSSFGYGDFVHDFKLLAHQCSKLEIEKFLLSSAIHVDFADFFDTGVLTPQCPVKKVFVNQLPANNPMEDRWNIGLTQVDGVVSSLMYTVLDGHSGSACAHAVAWAVLDYVAAANLDTDKLKTALASWTAQDIHQPYHLSRRLRLMSPQTNRPLGHAATSPPTKLAFYLKDRLQAYMKELINNKFRSMDPVDTMTEAMLRLDRDLCSMGHDEDEEEEKAGKRLRSSDFIRTPGDDATFTRDLIHAAMTGCVGTVGRLFWRNVVDESTESKPHPLELHIANVGDCGAVLLREHDYCSGQPPCNLIPILCTTPHRGADNRNEIRRVCEEHPDDRVTELFRNGGRLLGELAPSRAFGNVRYKWSADRLLELSRYLSLDKSSSGGTNDDDACLMPLPHPYTSPPYLTARPDVARFELQPTDRYLILATDGLWDAVSPATAAQVVSRAMHSNQCPASRLLLQAISALPPQMARAVVFRDNGDDENAFTRRASALLSLPPGTARYYRDDITIVVLELFGSRGKSLT